MTTADRWLLPDGVEELLPGRAARAEQLRRRLLDLYDGWGYQLVMPPLLEFTDSLLVGLGSDVDLLTFKVTDQLTGRALGIRADITPQVARIDAHSLHGDGPVRLCYAGSVLHTRPKSVLASRSPIQIGAELYGDAGLASDGEVVLLMLETLRVAGLDRVTLDLGHVGIYGALIAAAGLNGEAEAQLFDALQRKATGEINAAVACVADARARQWLLALAQLQGDLDVLARAREAFAGAPQPVFDAIDELAAVAALVQARMPEVALYFDLAELRGYHYHTGLVFAALVPGWGQAVANGGRYDHVGEVFGRARPATGFSTDLKSLIALAVDGGDGDGRGAVLAPASDDVELWRVVQTLRADGERVISALPGQPAPAGCDRELVRGTDGWRVVVRNS